MRTALKIYQDETAPAHCNERSRMEKQREMSSYGYLLLTSIVFKQKIRIGKKQNECVPQGRRKNKIKYKTFFFTRIPRVRG